MKLTKRTRVVSAGVVMELNSDEMSHLITALGDYIRLMAKHGNLKGGNTWAWVEKLKNDLDDLRSVAQLEGIVSPIPGDPAPGPEPISALTAATDLRSNNQPEPPPAPAATPLPDEDIPF